MVPIWSQVLRPTRSKKRMGIHAKMKRTMPTPPVARFAVWGLVMPPFSKRDG
jgi:hypothetical protein